MQARYKGDMGRYGEIREDTLDQPVRGVAYLAPDPTQKPVGRRPMGRRLPLGSRL